MDKFFKKIGFSENAVSLILGVLVVIVLAVMAYNLFRVKPVNGPATTENQPKEELTVPASAVSLPIEHTVADGESLWTISEKYYTSGYNWVDIANTNGVQNPDQIFVGQKLTIPNVSVRGLGPQVTLSKIEGGTYTTLKGDNLWTIAIRAYGDGYRYGDIARVNNIANPRLIFSGNVLIIPRP